jgi:glucose-1-phosphate thymidylyltransferase
VKGIILAGGSGSRLWPATLSVSKQLLPVYDKPMIYYPLSTLMLSGITEILIITTQSQNNSFKTLLGDGHQLGISIEYQIQDYPEGLAQAFVIGEKFIGQEPVALILGDNIFHGTGLGRDLRKYTNPKGANIFGYEVVDPQSYGVIQVSENGEIVSIEEKPNNPKSNLAIPGVYFFDSTVVNKAKRVKKSARGEYEIISVLEMYLEERKLRLTILPRGTIWMDCGTPRGLNSASNYMQSIEDRQGVKVACIEEIALQQNWISEDNLQEIAKSYGSSEYGQYLKNLRLTS